MVCNALLTKIPAIELRRLLSAAELVPLAPRQILHHYKLPMKHVYFVEHGLVSVAAKIGPEKFAEVWLIGSDGMVGAPLILAPHTEPLYRRTVQVAGDAFRIASGPFRQMLPHLPNLGGFLNAYLSAILIQTAQAGACNAAHPLKQRLARWLLLARSSLGSDELALTHGTLAELLCVRRASITDCLDHLAGLGLIRLDRGLITIMDHGLLAHFCCDCFKIIDHEYKRQVLSYSLGDAVRGRAALDGGGLTEKTWPAIRELPNS